MLTLIFAAAAMRPEVMTRRGALVAASTLLASTQLPADAATTPPAAVDLDRPGHMVWGVIPPTPLGSITYQQLLDASAAGQIVSVQIAVQHDNVMATTVGGARWACALPDSEFAGLLVDATRADGSLPFEVLPIDETKAQIRDIAQRTFSLAVGAYLADQFDLLPFDLTAYDSLADREAARERMARGEGRKEKPLRWALRMAAERLRSPSPTGTSQQPSAEADATGGLGDDELRRVLGLPARPLAEMRKSVLESKTHQKVVAVHDELVGELKSAMRDTEWVTPLTLGRPLEEYVPS
jgi:hypothetical protein